MEAVIQFLKDSSLDKIFIISGILLIILSALGKYKDIIQIDKGGRIFGGIVGIILVFSGLFVSFRNSTNTTLAKQGSVDSTISKSSFNDEPMTRQTARQQNLPNS